MIGTLINVGTVLTGGTLGTLLGNRLPERIRVVLMDAIGLTTILIGVRMGLQTSNVILVLGSLIIGAVIGETIGIDRALNTLGERLEGWVTERTRSVRPGGGSYPPAQEVPSGQEADGRVSAGQEAGRGVPSGNKTPLLRAGGGGGLPRGRGRFAQGFVSASLLFCVGPMTIMGAIQDGLTGDYSTLAVKAMMDGFASMALASSLGIGVIFSALVVLVYQGGLTLAAVWAEGILTDVMVKEMTAAGGVVIFALGLGMLEIKRVNVANLLPAIFVAPLLVALAG